MICLFSLRVLMNFKKCETFCAFILLIGILLSTLTKVVIFRNAGKVKSNEKWNLNGHPLEIVEKFVYLGVLLNFNSKYPCMQKQLACQARKTMFAFKSNVKNMCLNVYRNIDITF